MKVGPSTGILGVVCVGHTNTKCSINAHPMDGDAHLPMRDNRQPPRCQMCGTNGVLTSRSREHSWQERGRGAHLWEFWPQGGRCGPLASEERWRHKDTKAEGRDRDRETHTETEPDWVILVASFTAGINSPKPLGTPVGGVLCLDSPLNLGHTFWWQPT